MRASCCNLLSGCTAETEESGMPDAGCGMQDAGCGMTDAGCGMQDARCGMTDAGCGMQDAGCGILDANAGWAMALVMPVAKIQIQRNRM